MSTVTLTKVWRGQAETRFGPKPKISIKTQENGDNWITSFTVKGTENWSEGMSVDVIITQNGQYLNFKPVVSGASSTSVNNLDTRVEALEKAVFGGKQQADIQAEPDLESEFADDTGF